MSICKIGETKVINGKRYRKEKGARLCSGCAFEGKDGCTSATKEDRIDLSIENGGSECYGTIWILADDQPEAPTATPPRDEVREQRRFQAAVAAMQGMLAIGGHDAYRDDLARFAVYHADALLSELDRTGAGK